MKEVWDLLDWRKELFKSKEASLHASRVVHAFTSREPTFLSRVVNAYRVVNFPFCHESWTPHESSTFQNFKSHNFSDLSSFLVLGIISSTDVQIEWFKLLWKVNSEYYNFHEESFLRKRLLNGQKYPWTDYICLNGNSWRGGDAFPSPWL